MRYSHLLARVDVLDELAQRPARCRPSARPTGAGTFATESKDDEWRTFTEVARAAAPVVSEATEDEAPELAQEERFD